MDVYKTRWFSLALKKLAATSLQLTPAELCNAQRTGEIIDVSGHA
jgi:hypothetical protein